MTGGGGDGGGVVRRVRAITCCERRDGVVRGGGSGDKVRSPTGGTGGHGRVLGAERLGATTGTGAGWE